MARNRKIEAEIVEENRLDLFAVDFRNGGFLYSRTSLKNGRATTKGSYAVILPNIPSPVYTEDLVAILRRAAKIAGKPMSSIDRFEYREHGYEDEGYSTVLLTFKV